MLRRPKTLVQKARAPKGPRVSRVPVDVTSENIEALNTEMERAVSMDLATGLRRFRKDVPKASLDRAFNARSYHGLRETIPWTKLDDRVEPASDSLKQVMEETVRETVKGIASPERAEYLQDAANPAMEAFHADRVDKFVQDLGEPARQSIQEVAAHATRTGRDSEMVASEVRDSLGLNDVQVRALANYRRKLEKDGMRPSQVNRMAELYQERLLDQRAKAIAVTEVRQASNNAQIFAWQAMQEDGLVEAEARKRWVLGWENACPNICRPMDGVDVPVGEPWKLPNGKSAMVPTDSHPNCRCYMMLVTSDD